jgi:hypothetical protein
MAAQVSGVRPCEIGQSAGCQEVTDHCRGSALRPGGGSGLVSGGFDGRLRGHKTGAYRSSPGVLEQPGLESDIGDPRRIGGTRGGQYERATRGYTGFYQAIQQDLGEQRIRAEGFACSRRQVAGEMRAAREQQRNHDRGRVSGRWDEVREQWIVEFDPREFDVDGSQLERDGIPKRT